MELIFGEGTDGDAQAMLFEPLANNGYCVTVEWNDVTDPHPGGEVTGYVVGVSNARPEGEITVHEMDTEDVSTNGGTIGEPIVIPIGQITRLEIH